MLYFFVLLNKLDFVLVGLKCKFLKESRNKTCSAMFKLALERSACCSKQYISAVVVRNRLIALTWRSPVLEENQWKLLSCLELARSLSFPLVPRWHMGPPTRISISACPSPVYWQSPMLVPRLSAPPPQISAMLFWACPSCASLVESTLAPLLQGCCSAISKHGTTILTFFSWHTQKLVPCYSSWVGLRFWFSLARKFSWCAVDISFGMCLVFCKFLSSFSNIPIRKVTHLECCFSKFRSWFSLWVVLISRLHLGCQRLGLLWLILLVHPRHCLRQYWLYFQGR